MGKGSDSSAVLKYLHTEKVLLRGFQEDFCRKIDVEGKDKRYVFDQV